MDTKIKDFSKAYKKLLQTHRRQKAALLKKWNVACLKEVGKITTTEQAESAFKAAPWIDVTAKRKILEIWARLCVTREEYARALDKSSNFSRLYYLDHPVLVRWNEVAEDMLRHADTADKVVEVAFFCPAAGLSDVRQQAFLKWITFFNSSHELRDAWRWDIDRDESRWKSEAQFLVEWYLDELYRREREEGIEIPQLYSFL